MIKRLSSSLLLWIFLLGAPTPLLAGEAHPSGPEGRPFSERTVRIQGKTNDILLTLSFPKPDEIVDWTVDGSYNAADRFPRPLTLRFEYKGHFWQGTFGSVGLDVKIDSRKQDSTPWKDLETLLQSVRLRQIAHNQATKGEVSRSREELMEPFLSQLNGNPCVQQYVQIGVNPKEEARYYFLLDDDHALEVVLLFVDNSDRPGLTKSDWRPRAVGFSNQLLSRVKVVTTPTQLSN